MQLDDRIDEPRQLALAAIARGTTGATAITLFAPKSGQSESHRSRTFAGPELVPKADWQENAPIADVVDGA
jgi:hypothetical protein